MSNGETTKRNLILQYLRRYSESNRKALSKALNISNSRVCGLVKEMLEEGLLEEDHRGGERRGRNPVPLRLNPRWGDFLGFDMEAKCIRLVVTDFSGQVVWKRREEIQSDTPRQFLMEKICHFIRDGILATESKGRSLKGVGLAASGILDLERGVILEYPFLPAARRLPLRDLVSSETNLPCTMINNIWALTYAEWERGAAKEFENFVCIAVRSGVGAGIVINNRLYPGSHGYAGEAGYMSLPMGDRIGEWKHLQEMVSEKALDMDVKEDNGELPSDVARQAGQILGSQLASISVLLDPDGIVLAGQLVSPESKLWDHILRVYRRMVTPETAETVRILPAQVGSYAAAIGATDACFREVYGG